MPPARVLQTVLRGRALQICAQVESAPLSTVDATEFSKVQRYSTVSVEVQGRRIAVKLSVQGKLSVTEKLRVF